MDNSRIESFIRKQNVAFICSVDETGYPNVKAMLKPRKIYGLRQFYFSTNTSSMRVKQYMNNPKSNRSIIRKYKIFLFTDAKTSARIKSLEVEAFETIPVEAQIWDLSRLFEVCTSPSVEYIEINFKDYVPNGIPCIEANVGDGKKYKSYLGVIPGELLADIYDKYGAIDDDGKRIPNQSVKDNLELAYAISVHKSQG